MNALTSDAGLIAKTSREGRVANRAEAYFPVAKSRDRHRRTPSLFVACLLLAAITGCVSKNPAPPAKLATDVNPDEAKPTFWLDKPATQTIVDSSFDRLYDAAQNAAKSFQFRIDRLDYRNGLVTTQPLISKQFFEFWKNDTLGLHDQALASTATYRRTIRFSIARTDDGRFEMTPKVLVERQAILAKRITSVTQYQGMFSAPDPASYGSRETDLGIAIPATYWYATGRDEILEEALANKVRKAIQ